MKKITWFVVVTLICLISANISSADEYRYIVNVDGVDYSVIFIPWVAPTYMLTPEAIKADADFAQRKTAYLANKTLEDAERSTYSTVHHAQVFSTAPGTATAKSIVKAGSDFVDDVERLNRRAGSNIERETGNIRRDINREARNTLNP